MLELAFGSGFSFVVLSDLVGRVVDVEDWAGFLVMDGGLVGLEG